MGDAGRIGGSPSATGDHRRERQLRSEASSGCRSDRSLHSRHTDSGMTPALISSANALHPRQSPKAASRKAAPVSRPTTTYEPVCSPNPYQSTSAVVEKTTPTAWANRFGRPGHQLRLDGQAGGDHPGGQLAERTERGAGQDPGPEAVGQGDEDPGLVEGDGGEAHEDDAGGHGAGRIVVDGVGEREHANTLPAGSGIRSTVAAAASSGPRGAAPNNVPC